MWQIVIESNGQKASPTTAGEIMKRSSNRIRFVLLLAFVPQVVTSQGALAQGQRLQRGDEAQVVLRDPNLAPFEGSVIGMLDDGFAIEVRGESRPRRVNFDEVESLRLSTRLGGRARNGALMGGAILGVPGFLLGYCFQLFSDGCAEDFGAGLEVGLPAAAIGGLIGAGIGLLFDNYSPWEDVSDLGRPGRSGALDKLSVDVRPYPDGRIGLGVRLALGGGR